VSAAEACEAVVERAVEESERLLSTLGLLLLLLLLDAFVDIGSGRYNVISCRQDFVVFPLLSGAWSS
jgi:hypothetical protein